MPRRVLVFWSPTFTTPLPFAFAHAHAPCPMLSSHFLLFYFFLPLILLLPELLDLLC